MYIRDGTKISFFWQNAPNMIAQFRDRIMSECKIAFE